MPGIASLGSLEVRPARKYGLLENIKGPISLFAFATLGDLQVST